MAIAYNFIASSIVGSGGTATVTFSSIAGTYTDLLVKISARTDRASTNDYFSMKFNSNSANYSDRSLYGNGSAATSETGNSTTAAFMFAVPGASNTASAFGNADIYIPNYASANYKSVSSDAVIENNATAAIAGLNANLWSNTAAITSVSFTAIGSFIQYSSFYLYGVLKY